MQTSRNLKTFPNISSNSLDSFILYQEEKVKNIQSLNYRHVYENTELEYMAGAFRICLQV
jgi:hypothetical protein